MLLKVIWFIVNAIFVASFIVFLFRHRVYTQAKLQGASEQQLTRLKKISNIAGGASVLLFLASAAVFITNMAING